MTGDRGAFVEVRFALERDAAGRPPARSEGLRAVDLGGGLARIDGSPWFASGIASGDVVRTAPDEQSVLWSVERVEWSGNCTIRVTPFKDGILAGSRRAVIDLFAPMGVAGEGSEQFGLVALKVPPDADVAAVKGRLVRGRREGWWDFEEGCVGDAWIDAAAE